jgi:hypothetical protein
MPVSKSEPQPLHLIWWIETISRVPWSWQLQINRKIASLAARQRTLQERADALRRTVDANRRCPRADWQVHMLRRSPMMNAMRTGLCRSS